MLTTRAAIVRALRRALDDRGFIEVQTPLLVPGTCPDRGIRSFEVPDGGYLVSSTEYQLKRLYAEGVAAAYTLGANFRAGDVGRFHNPEFTMLEWGRAGATMSEVEAECEALLVAAHGAAGLHAPASVGRVTVRDLISRALNVEVGSWSGLARIGGPFSDDADLHLSWLIDTALRTLDPEVPTWVVAWPATMTASAGLDPTDPTVTQRSELYWRGLEIADGFPFVRDGAWQRARTAEENAARTCAGLGRVTEDERFLVAVALLPEGAGMALGVDRLCLAVMGGQRLSDVMAFGWEER